MYYSSNPKKKCISLLPNFLVTLLVVLFGVCTIGVILNPGFCWAFQKQHEEFSELLNKHDMHILKESGYCGLTSDLASNACKFEFQEQFNIAKGKCINLSNVLDAIACYDSAQEEKAEAKQLCKDQFAARNQVCAKLGQGPYDPELIPENFEAITSDNANPFLPLVAGTQWVYEGETDEGTEVITVTVTDQIKEIEYPAESGKIFSCVVVHDVVELNGELKEDTYDWYAQDSEGNVWYFGEIVKNYEDGELADLDGSWKAGVEGAIPGISMPANPQVKDIYRQEFTLGEAEDIGEVVNRGGEEVSVPFGSFSEDDDILKTADYTPIEPGIVEHKYYAPSVGMILEEDPDTGERVELISMGQITP